MNLIKALNFVLIKGKSRHLMSKSKNAHLQYKKMKFSGEFL